MGEDGRTRTRQEILARGRCRFSGAEYGGILNFKRSSANVFKGKFHSKRRRNSQRHELTELSANRAAEFASSHEIIAPLFVQDAQQRADYAKLSES